MYLNEPIGFKVRIKNSYMPYLVLLWKHLSGKSNKRMGNNGSCLDQIKSTSLKLKEKTNTKDQHIRKILQEMTDPYHS
tara:strand:+ start:657 stop:890 length:234 start_codon:yes stop_codon:yes gene_type:complete